MTIKTEDISFVYSGGSNNLDPSKSIGGVPSINPINGTIDSLFNYVKREYAEEGYTDYRCFYIFNNSETDTVYNANVYFENQIEGISYCQIGIAKSIDSQTLTLNPTPDYGTFQLEYEDYITQNIDWNSEPTIFAKNIENALNDLEVLSGVVVQRILSNSFLISFAGDDNNRSHEDLAVSLNNLNPSTTITISKSSQGQPINSIAPLLATSQTVPYGVVFYDTNSKNRIYVGDLRPKDGVPIWIKRYTFGSVSNDEINGFAFRFSGNLQKNPTIQPFNIRPCFYYE